MTEITRHPSASTDTTGFNANFSNPENAYATDTSYATVTGDARPRNDEYATNWRGFDFSAIGADDTIDSVAVHVIVKVSTAWSQGEFRSSV